MEDLSYREIFDMARNGEITMYEAGFLSKKKKKKEEENEHMSEEEKQKVEKKARRKKFIKRGLAIGAGVGLGAYAIHRHNFVKGRKANIGKGEENLNAYLRDHDYDPKTHTIAGNGRRYKIKFVDNEHFMTGMGGSPAAAAPVFNSEVKGYNNQKIYLRKKESKIQGAAVGLDELKGGEILLNRDSMKNLSRGEIDTILSHEIGHVRDYSATRKVGRTQSIESRIRENAIKNVPKELRHEFLQLKKAEKAATTPKEKAKAAAEISKFADRLRTHDMYKNDIDLKRKHEYDTFTKMADKQAKHNSNAHDRAGIEVKADSYASHANNHNAKQFRRNLNGALDDAYSGIADNLSDNLGLGKIGKKIFRGVGKIGAAVGRRHNISRSRTHQKTKDYLAGTEVLQNESADDITLYELLEAVEYGYINTEDALVYIED